MPAPRQFRSAIFATAVLAGSALFARPPIVDALTQQSARGFSLDTNLGYRLIAPVSNVFDSLTLLSLPQLFSTFGFVCLLAAAARAILSRRRRIVGLPAFRIRDHVRFGANIFGAIIAVSGLALLSPRPMAALRIGSPDLLAVDFHSHTSASHDGRPGFTPDENREWHRRSGFDAAYITDHHSFAGARAAARANPAVAGNGIVLLTGLEYLDGDEHLLALGLDPHTTNPERREWHPISEVSSGSSSAVPALLILSLPGNVNTIPPDEHVGSARLAGLELSDGSPHGLEQAAADFSDINDLARKLNLSLVAGSDNHGWGKTAAAWTVLRIPGWRSMTPDQLDAAIRRTILSRGRFASSVISRRLPPAASPLSIAFTGPGLVVEILRDIGWPERISWIFWTWSFSLGLVFVRRRKAVRLPHPHWTIPELIPEGAAERAPLLE